MNSLLSAPKSVSCTPLCDQTCPGALADHIYPNVLCSDLAEDLRAALAKVLLEGLEDDLRLVALVLDVEDLDDFSI